MLLNRIKRTEHAIFDKKCDNEYSDVVESEFIVGDELSTEVEPKIKSKRIQYINKLSYIPKGMYRIIENAFIQIENEERYTIKVDDLKENINIKKRMLLTDWIYKVYHKLNMTSETFHTAIFFFDEIIFKAHIKFEDYQIYAIVCLWMANKIARSRQGNLRLSIFLQIDSNHVFEADDFLKKELQICEILDWNFNRCTPYTFANIFVSLFEIECYNDIVSFFLDSTTLCIEFSTLSPSFTAACIILCAAYEKITLDELCEVANVSDGVSLVIYSLKLANFTRTLMDSRYGIFQRYYENDDGKHLNWIQKFIELYGNYE